MVSAVGTLGAVYVVKEDDRFYYKDASVLCFKNLGKLFKSTLNNRLRRNLACVIDKSSRGAKLKRAFEELP